MTSDRVPEGEYDPTTAPYRREASSLKKKASGAGKAEKKSIISGVISGVAHNPDLRASHVAYTVFAPEQKEPMASPGQYRVLRGFVAFQSYAILFLLVMVVLAAVGFAPQYIYHMVVLGKDGLPEKVKPVYAFDQPILSRTAISNMALNVATQILTFGFNNADERILRARRYFTEKAWNRFVKGFLNPEILDKIKSQQQILTAIATKGPVIIREGPTKDNYEWVVQVPVLISYQTGRKVVPVSVILEITFVKSDSLKHPEGVAIDSWSMK
jgi:intracellular multiplication protein IcmL